MAGNPYGYTPEEMTSVGNQLVSIRSQIGEQIAAAKGAVDGLIGSGFTSAASSGAYAEQFQNLSRALNDVNEQLEPLGNFLKQYAQAVQSMDQEFRGQLG